MRPSPVPRVHGFPPVVDTHARILILGSMPGVASLQAGQYYAHPRNQFWPIVGELCGAHPSLPYRGRLLALRRAGIALWDVLHSCVRAGSLDAAIEQGSVEANDLPALLRRHPGIVRVCCNGSASRRALERHFGPTLRRERPLLDIRLLPSTSPANAGTTYGRKLELWAEALGSVGGPR